MYKFDTISTNELSLREASLRDASHALLAITLPVTADGVDGCNAECIKEVAIRTTFTHMEYVSAFRVPVIKSLQQTFLTNCVSK